VKVKLAQFVLARPGKLDNSLADDSVGEIGQIRQIIVAQSRLGAEAERPLG
jgi:hypothetical protein